MDTIEMRRTIFPMRRTKLPDVHKIEQKLYLSMQGLLAQRAYEAAKKAGLVDHREELRQQADLLFVIALRNFDDSCGVSFSTYLWTVVHNGLIDFGKSLAKHWDPTLYEFGTVSQDGEYSDPVDMLIDGASEGSYNLIEDACSWSADAQELAALCVAGFASSLEKLQKLAVKRMGWSIPRFNQASAEIQSAVNAW